jgi:hypothetical protein
MVTQTTKKRTISSVTRKSNLTPNPLSGQNRGPGEVEIRELAEIIYSQRIIRGDQGSANEDWLEAEKNLRYRYY